MGGEEPRPGLPAERLPGAMKCLVDFANANDGINELHKAAILHFAFAYYHPYFDGNGRTARLFHLWYLVQQGYPAALFTSFPDTSLKTRTHITKPTNAWREML